MGKSGLILPLSKDAGRLIVEQYLKTIPPLAQDNPWVICDSYTEEYEWGWVFYWHNRRFIETKDFRYEVGGNGPIIVSKSDGALYRAGTRKGTEYYVEAFLNGTGVKTGHLQRI